MPVGLLSLVPSFNAPGFAPFAGSGFPGSAFPGSTLALTLPGGYEWLVIGLIGLLLLGKRLPLAARGIGESYREFRRGMREAESPQPTEVSATGSGARAGSPAVAATSVLAAGSSAPAALTDRVALADPVRRSELTVTGRADRLLLPEPA